MRTFKGLRIFLQLFIPTSIHFVKKIRFRQMKTNRHHFKANCVLGKYHWDELTNGYEIAMLLI